MKQYQNLLQTILTEGTRQANRTGIDAISIPGAMLKFDLQEGFPAVTTKKLFFNAVKGELLGFLRGYDNAADFRKLGCNIWDQNANDPGLPTAPNKWISNPNRKGVDDLGRIYGVQWRSWRGRPNVINVKRTNKDNEELNLVAEFEYNTVDQLQVALDTIRKDPTNRRIIINAWRPDEFDQMALPPCHIMSQFIVNVERKELSLCWYQRSVDSFLGLPFNIASYALFLSLMAKLTGYTPRHLTGFLADTHIYVNHLDQVNEQLSREPFPLPILKLDIPDNLDFTGADVFNSITPEMISLENYQHHEAIKAPMAV